MKIAICDDDVQAINEISCLLETYAFDRNVILDYRPFVSYEELLDGLSEFDVFLVDYKMAGMNGLEFARFVYEKYGEKKSIVFITAYPEIVYEAFEVRAFRFLLKPLDKEKFFKTFDDLLATSKVNSRIIIKGGGETYIFSLNEILYMQVERKDTTVVLKDKKVVCHNTLEYYEKELYSVGFFRTHRSFLVNLNRVKSFKNNQVEMDNGDIIDLSRKKYPEFCKRFFEISG